MDILTHLSKTARRRFFSTYLLVLIGASLVSCGGSGLDEQLAGNIELEGSSYEVYLVGNDSIETTGYFYYKRIELRENKSADPFLVIDSLDHPSWDVVATFDDKNFDGYPDIAILTEDPAYRYNPHSLWLYNADQKKFIYNDFMEYILHSSYWQEEEKQVLISSFDRAETYTDTYYSFENGDFEIVKEEITVDGTLSMRLSMTTITERVNGKMKVTSTSSQAGGLKLKKSGSITDKEDIKSFLGMFGDSPWFQKIVRKGSTFERYHESCETADFSFELEAGEELEGEGFSELFYPIVDWEEMYEGPSEKYSIQKINYRSNGNSFTLFMRYIEEIYEEDSELSYGLYDEIETMSITFSEGLSSWIVRYSEYEDAHYAPEEQATNLPMNDDECEDYGEEN